MHIYNNYIYVPEYACLPVPIAMVTTYPLLQYVIVTYA